VIETLLARPRNGDGRHNWRGEDLKGCRLENDLLTKVDFGAVEDLHFENMELVGLKFDHATLTNCSFINCRISECFFASAWLDRCTFKHSTFDRSTFSGAVFVRCDLYRTVFLANNLFTHVVFSLVSLSQATLIGTLGLRRSAFVGARASRSRREATPRPTWASQGNRGTTVAVRTPAESMKVRGTLPKDPLIQMDEAEYRALLEQVPDMTVGVDASLDGRLAEAADVWRNLSALWTSQGASADAGWAYVQAKRLERADASPRRWCHQGADERSPTHRFLTWSLLWIADALCGFGNSLLRAICWLPVLVLAWGLVFWASGVVHSGRSTASFPKAMLFSMTQVTTVTPTALHIQGSTGHVLASVETLLGIALLGLIGFVLGNTIRNS
jgi:uncharacterized protein YjbI with pentapeptide repeats